MENASLTQMSANRRYIIRSLRDQYLDAAEKEYGAKTVTCLGESFRFPALKDRAAIRASAVFSILNDVPDAMKLGTGYGENLMEAAKWLLLQITDPMAAVLREPY